MWRLQKQEDRGGDCRYRTTREVIAGTNERDQGGKIERSGESAHASVSAKRSRRPAGSIPRDNLSRTASRMPRAVALWA